MKDRQTVDVVLSALTGPYRHWALSYSSPYPTACGEKWESACDLACPECARLLTVGENRIYLVQQGGGGLMAEGWLKKFHEQWDRRWTFR